MQFVVVAIWIQLNKFEFVGLFYDVILSVAKNLKRDPSRCSG